MAIEPIIDENWNETTVEQLRAAVDLTGEAHREAVESGGYDRSLGYDVLATDPVEVTQETLQIIYGSAAELLESHLSGEIDLSLAPALTSLVNMAVDRAGIAGD